MATKKATKSSGKASCTKKWPAASPVKAKAAPAAGTKHIGTPKGSDEFAEICLCPGDPLRAKFIADNFLTNCKLIQQVRNMYGYTGYYKGVRVSVMGTGMGIASSQIYFNELVKFYGVKTLIRVGTCGTMCAPEKTKLGDIVLAMGAGTDSSLNRMRFGGWDYPATASYELLRICDNIARDPKMGIQKQLKDSDNKCLVGNIFSADSFYGPKDHIQVPLLKKFNVIGIEMEAACLYSLANENNVDALGINTVSDEIHMNGYDPITETYADPQNKFWYKDMPPEQRQSKLRTMVTLALETVVEWNKNKSKWASSN